MIRAQRLPLGGKEVTVFRQIAVTLLLSVGTVSGFSQDPDPWQPMRFLIGNWQGTASGEAGTGTVSRSYEFILNHRFIQEQNTSTYRPQEKNEKGEVHHHLGILSVDRGRKAVMLRHFHEEGFVNLFALSPPAGRPPILIFASEDFENFDDSWKAKETYEIISNDEFIETFELAPPGNPFEVYSRNHFKRVP